MPTCRQKKKQNWDMLEWDEGEVPEEITVEELNKFLFNQDTVDKVLGHLMTNGIHVNGGDRLGKTIIFAKNQKHAEFIEERFNANWPNLAGHFTRIITHRADYAQSLIDDFSFKDKEPFIAISVDMMDTGIDVPEVVNLVFFKLVRSKTKFWQMVGRGTRLCPDLFGPGQDKDQFRIFDFCQNLEFFGQDPATKEAPVAKSLTERLFAARLNLVRSLDDGALGDQDPDYSGLLERYVSEVPYVEEMVTATTGQLRGLVASMSLDNFVVRSKRTLVERYQDGKNWDTLDDKVAEELTEIAGLPNTLDTEGEEAKRFDLMMLSLQLAIINGSKRFDKLREQLLEICAALEAGASVPAIKQHIRLIEDVQSDEWWEGRDGSASGAGPSAVARYRSSH